MNRDYDIGRTASDKFCVNPIRSISDSFKDLTDAVITATIAISEFNLAYQEDFSELDSFLGTFKIV